MKLSVRRTEPLAGKLHSTRHRGSTQPLVAMKGRTQISVEGPETASSITPPRYPLLSCHPATQPPILPARLPGAAAAAPAVPAAGALRDHSLKLPAAPLAHSCCWYQRKGCLLTPGQRQHHRWWQQGLLWGEPEAAREVLELKQRAEWQGQRRMPCRWQKPCWAREHQV